MDNASSSTSGTQNRQKRVLPSRSRRGGPGVGTCEVDVLILETLKRRSENEPLIPSNTSFILTTNSKYASNDPGGAITVNMVANDRYFDRPEVVKAFREQVVIQTPEFSSIGESSNVGGRFRPRAAEDDGAETSDTTYEKRHRKFETFEKRQRLREKEKLKHEHYKMKERLEQLRAMDSAAFMTLPASSFSPMSKEPVADPEEIAAASSPYTNPNGYITHAEGERRRKEMLEVATMLEERYRVLLPPDRVRRAPEPVSLETASRSNVQSRDGDDSETDQTSVIGEKLRLRLPPRSSTSTTPAPSSTAIKPTNKKPRFSASSKQSSVIRVLRTTVSTPSPPPSPSPLPRAEASPLSPSPTIDMNISSPEPTPPSPSPIPTVATALPQTPVSSPSMLELSRPDPSPSNYATRVSRIVSGQQNSTCPEQKTALEQEMPVTPPDQDMLIIEQERSPVPSDQEREKSPTLRNQEQPKHDQAILPTPPVQESMPEPERRPVSPKPENFNTRDQGRLQSPPVPNRLPTPLEREKSMTPGHQSLTPLPRDRPVTPEPEKLAPPLEREKTTTPEPERLPTPSVPERLATPLVDVTDEDLQDSLPEQEPSKRKSIEPLADDRESGKAESEDEMSVRAELVVLAPQNEPEEEIDVELEADKSDRILRPNTPPSITVTGQAAIADATMDAIPDATLTERTVLPDVAMSQEPVGSGPTVIKQADVPVHEVGPILDLPIVPEQRSRTESVDIEKMPSPMPMSSISAPRSRIRKKARLDSSVQPNETVSAPVRAPRIPKNHVTYIGASGEVEVTASAIIKAAVHRTQRDATRHLNAFGAPVPNVIIQMGPPFELPEWVFPPLSPAESEHAHGDFDAIEDLQLDPKAPLDRQVTSNVQVATETDLKDPLESSPDAIAMDSKEPMTADYTTSIEVDPVEPVIRPTRQPGPKNKMPLPLPPPEPETYEEDAVSLGDEDTQHTTITRPSDPI